jgi:hypothetical protein
MYIFPHKIFRSVPALPMLSVRTCKNIFFSFLDINEMTRRNFIRGEERAVGGSLPIDRALLSRYYRRRTKESCSSVGYLYVAVHVSSKARRFNDHHKYVFRLFNDAI